MNKPQSNLEYSTGYGENYANLRKKEYNGEKNYTVRELSAELNIAASTISQIEKEKREPTVEQVMIYKKFFGVSLDYLTGETKTINPKVQDICKTLGLQESTINHLKSLSSAEKRILEYIIGQTKKDNKIDIEINLFDQLLLHCDELMHEAVNNNISKKICEIKPLIRLSDESRVYGRDFVLWGELKELEEKVRAKGFSIVESSFAVEAKMIFIERLFGEILSTIADRQAESFIDNATWVSSGEPVRTPVKKPRKKN